MRNVTNGIAEVMMSKLSFPSTLNSILQLFVHTVSIKKPIVYSATSKENRIIGWLSMLANTTSFENTESAFCNPKCAMDVFPDGLRSLR